LKRAADVDLPPVVLDRAHPLPKQIGDALRAAMHSGRLKPDHWVPATRVFARALGVSRQIIVAAYEDLAMSGHLRGRVGDGSYVAWNDRPCWVSTSTVTIVDPDGNPIRVLVAC
jgi:DNA-binding transcriptional regulator YhcF (GntR family)